MLLLLPPGLGYGAAPAKSALVRSARQPSGFILIYHFTHVSIKLSLIASTVWFLAR